MASPTDRARTHDRLRALIEFARGEGWDVLRTHDGWLRLLKPDCAPMRIRSVEAEGRGTEDRGKRPSRESFRG